VIFFSEVDSALPIYGPVASAWKSAVTGSFDEDKNSDPQVLASVGNIATKTKQIPCYKGTCEARAPSAPRASDEKAQIKPLLLPKRPTRTALGIGQTACKPGKSSSLSSRYEEGVGLPLSTARQGVLLNISATAKNATIDKSDGRNGRKPEVRLYKIHRHIHRTRVG